MTTTTLLRTILGGSLAAMLHAVPAHAQATSTFVSGVGDDAATCARTDPCRTFNGAISKTAQNGEIRCLDAGGYGAVTITKSITIDCHEEMASILSGAASGIVINITSAADPLKTVRLRNISINGTGGGTRSGVHGISILAANTVFLDDLRIDGFTQFGIRDNRAGNGLLFVRNSIVRDNGGTAIAIFPSSGIVGAVIENSTGEGSNFGLSAGNNSKVIAKRSVFSGNVTAGVNADAGSQLALLENTISNNSGSGILTAAGSSVRMSNNDIGFNSANGLNGPTLTFRDNRIFPTLGTNPTGTPFTELQ